MSDLARSHRVADLLAGDQFTAETVNHLAAAAQQVKYKSALTELRKMVEGVTTKPKRGGGTRPASEHEYQDWFEKHTWVFGTEYLRRINLRDTDPHASVDIILETADGFFDVLELKVPEASVLLYDTSHNTWYFSADMAKAIAQATKYIKAIERNADRIYADEGIALVRPRVRIVIGRSSDWTREQHEAFRRLGASLHSIEALTFDHVMQRAQRLIDCYERHPELEMGTFKDTESGEHGNTTPGEPD